MIDTLSLIVLIPLSMWVVIARLQFLMRSAGWLKRDLLPDPFELLKRTIRRLRRK